MYPGYVQNQVQNWLAENRRNSVLKFGEGRVSWFMRGVRPLGEGAFLISFNSEGEVVYGEWVACSFEPRNLRLIHGAMLKA